MITSAENPKIKHVRKLLASKKQREKTDTFVIEGVRLCEEAFSAAQRNIRLVLFDNSLSDRGKQIVNNIQNCHIDSLEVERQLFNRVSDTSHAQGILMELDIPNLAIPENPSAVLVLDQIQDPGNLGTILRTATAMHFQAVILTMGSADPFSPKVVRSAMGAHFRIPICFMQPNEIMDFCKARCRPPLVICACDGSAKSSVWDKHLHQPICVIIGSEAAGISPALSLLADDDIAIPMVGTTESLNASIAAAIIMYEVQRQRKKQ